MRSYELYTEHDLVCLLKEGNADAFAEIYHRFAAPLYRQAYNVLRDREEAKDTVQDLFTSIWNKRKELNLTNLSGYLYMANRNRLIKAIAHKKISSTYFEWLQKSVEEEAAPSDRSFREKQLKELINKEISKLPVKMRLVFTLSRENHLSHKEIASRLHISEATVKTQVKNALKTLRSKLEALLFLWVLYFFL